MEQYVIVKVQLPQWVLPDHMTDTSIQLT